MGSKQSVSQSVRLFFVIADKALFLLFLCVLHRLVLFVEDPPGWACNNPTLKLALLLGASEISDVPQFHRNFFVSLEKESDRDRQKEVVK